jgi:hypothetical protein
VAVILELPSGRELNQLQPPITDWVHPTSLHLAGVILRQAHDRDDTIDSKEIMWSASRRTLKEGVRVGRRYTTTQANAPRLRAVTGLAVSQTLLINSNLNSIDGKLKDRLGPDW